MRTLLQEQEDLRKADRDIGEGESRIADQERLLTRLRLDGRETLDGERLLIALRTTLTEWRTHRDEILEAIGRIEAQKHATP